MSYIEPRFPVKPRAQVLVADIADALEAITLADNCSPSLGKMNLLRRKFLICMRN